MSLSYLVDTDWVIHYLHGNPKIVEKLSAIQSDGLAMSIISLAELYEGVIYSTDPANNERGLNDFLTGVTILGIDDTVCRTFGTERGRLRKIVRRVEDLIDDFDLMIAATCLAHNLTLLSNNRKDFERVSGLTIISLP